ncbi:MAG: LD-carboxypeptidase [Myxococcales bacterium]|nr:MAG: LD-carboxypeptidase [Myxococcales bacterium]
MPRSFISPRVIHQGSTLAIVAPSGPFDTDIFRQAEARLAARYSLRYRQDIFSKDGFSAGNDKRRIEELVQALHDPEVDGILCARGGYGATRLLDSLDLDLIRREKKSLIGFSDITALHALWAEAGLQSFHAPMMASLAKMSDDDFEDWISVIEGSTPKAFDDLEVLVPGSATGPLLGGNLAVLCSLLGTPHFPPIDGAILFLEDIGEAPYRIDRMLTQLRQAGIFERIAALVFGAFTNCDNDSSPKAIDAVLRDFSQSLSIPTASGMPHGHPPFDRRAIVLGAQASLALLFQESQAVLRF